MDQETIERIVQQAPSSYRYLQTHISWILFSTVREKIGENKYETGVYTYKIKKPVKFSFLDFSTLAKRKKYCKEEIRLNKRLCPDLYIGLMRFVERCRRYFFESVESPKKKNEKIIEYAVKMRCLPERQKMDNLLKENKIMRSHIIALAYIIANFHKKTIVIKNKKYSSPLLVKKQIDDLAGVKDVVEKACGIEISKKIDFILKKCTEFISRNASLMRKRQKQGKIKDCHGDLHSANIFYVDKKFYVFDCIEFNKYFRYIDVASEIAFMAMDLDMFGREDLSKLFVEMYIKLSKDEELPKLLNLYKCYRANVRAKIAALAITNCGAEGSNEHITNYLNLCERYAKEL